MANRRKFTRRQFLKTAGVSTAGLIATGGLASCGGTSGTPTSSAASTPSGGTTPTSGVAGIIATGTAPAVVSGQVGKKTIGWVDISAPNLGDSRIIAAAKANCEALGWELLVGDAAGDPQKAITQVETFIAQKVDGIVDDIVDTNLLMDVIKKAADAKIPFVSIFGGGKTSPGVTVDLMPNEFVSAAKAGQWLVDAITAKQGAMQGTVIQLDWRGSAPVRRRVKVFETVMSDYEGFKIIQHTTQGPQAVEEDRKFVETTLQANPAGTIQGVFGNYDDHTLGAAQAIDAAGRADEFFGIGIDGNPSSFDLIRSGKSAFKATMANPLERMGWEAIDQLNLVFQGKPTLGSNGVLYYDVPLIDKTNVPAPGEYPPENLPKSGWKPPASTNK